MTSFSNIEQVYTIGYKVKSKETETTKKPRKHEGHEKEEKFKVMTFDILEIS